MPTCPDCGHDKVLADFACHTWPSGTRPDGSERWMSCQNCDSAIEYFCSCRLEDEVPNPDDPDGMWVYQKPACNCEWRYRHGFNQQNPRWADMQKYRPEWLPPDPDWKGGSILKHSDVAWVWLEY